MSIQSLKDASKKEVASPMTHEVYVIRMLSSYELTEANLNAILGGDEMKQEEAPKGLHAVAASNRLELAAQRHILEFGVITPKIFFGNEDETPSDAAHVRWIATDAAWLTDQIMKFSKLDEASRDQLNKLIKNDHSSASSTQSAADTDGSPANS